ncbi:MAG: hypothetical protein KGY67_05820 [Candidatus Thermoplasmatota archaeon]|nr:hypothetical protein [Candidatus Thermoplasmatota archaeon]
MDVQKVLLGIFAIFLLVSLSGCEEQATTTEKTFENIDFESDIVELDAANLEFVKDDEEFGGVRSVELKYRLHNPLKKSVTVVVDVRFYDESGREVFSEEDYTINLPSEFTENSLNTVTYGGSMVRVVDKVRITAFEQVE